MEFQEEIEELCKRIKQYGDSLKTEEATKNTLVMPFIKMLGYDPFNPTEVATELDTTVADNKDSHVDHVIVEDAEPIECSAVHMATRKDAIIKSIKQAWKAQYNNDLSELTREKLKAAKPGHGTDMYRTAQAQLKLELSLDASDDVDLLGSLEIIANISRSIKQELINRNYLNQEEELAKLKAENKILKQRVAQLEQSLAPLAKLSCEALNVSSSSSEQASV